MKKGFTIVELLGVIVLLSVLLLIAVPTYTNIQSKVKENIYEAKIANLLSKSEVYAEESGKMVFSINFLIENGIIEPDNEVGEYVDPRGDRDMTCDIVAVSFKNNVFTASLKESKECLDEETIENMYGMVHINVLDSTTHAKLTPNDQGWLRKSNIDLSYELDEEYQDLADKITSISWIGEENRDCKKDNLNQCLYYPVSNISVKQTNMILLMEFDINGVIIQSRTSKTVKLDMETPKVLDGSIIYNNNINTAGKRKVDFEITDNSGSGVQEYAVIKGTTCTGSEYNANKKSATDGIQTEYLGNGNYGICIKDKVGNLTSDDELNNSRNRFTVENVDETKPVITSFSVASKNASYHTLDVSLTIKATDDSGASGLKMCLSNTGYLKDCSWEAYQESKNFKVLGDYDGLVRTLYLSIQDEAGNIQNRSATYTVYKRCNEKTDFKEVSNNSNTCPKCGNVYYTSNQENYDKYLGGKCNSKNVSKKCNIPNDCCATDGVNISWSSWSSCAGTCDSGTQSRTATATSKYNGQNCTTKDNPNLVLSQSQTCSLESCCSKNNAVYSSWSSWSSCSKSCGGGTRTQTRTAKGKGGRTCSAAELKNLELTKSESCNTESCCSNNNLKYEYSSWSSCSTKCGTGTRTRKVTKVTSKITGQTCTKSDNSSLKEVGTVESESCSNSACCTSNIEYVDVGSWGPCSASCGPGTKKIKVQAVSKITGENCTATDNSSIKRERSESCNLKPCGPSVEYIGAAPGEGFEYYWVNINNFVGLKARVDCGINPHERPSGSGWNYTEEDSCVDAQAFRTTSSGVEAGEVTTILSGANGSGYRNSLKVSRFSQSQLGAIGISGYWRNSKGSTHYNNATLSIINVSGTKVWATAQHTISYGYVGLDGFSCNYDSNMCIYGKYTTNTSGRTWYYEAYTDGSTWTISDGFKSVTWGTECQNRFNPDYCIEMRGGLIFDTVNGESKGDTLPGSNHIFFDLPKYNNYGVYYENNGKRYINFYEGQGIGKEFKLIQTKEVDRKFEKFMIGNHHTTGIAVDDDGKKHFYAIDY